MSLYQCLALYEAVFVHQANEIEVQEFLGERFISFDNGMLTYRTSHGTHVCFEPCVLVREDGMTSISVVSENKFYNRYAKVS